MTTLKIKLTKDMENYLYWVMSESRWNNKDITPEKIIIDLLEVELYDALKCGRYTEEDGEKAFWEEAKNNKRTEDK